MFQNGSANVVDRQEACFQGPGQSDSLSGLCSIPSQKSHMDIARDWARALAAVDEGIKALESAQGSADKARRLAMARAFFIDATAAPEIRATQMWNAALRAVFYGMQELMSRDHLPVEVEEYARLCGLIVCNLYLGADHAGKLSKEQEAHGANEGR